jgi:hypothetical protein
MLWMTWWVLFAWPFLGAKSEVYSFGVVLLELITVGTTECFPPRHPIIQCTLVSGEINGIL